MNHFIPPFKDLSNLSDREKDMFLVLDHISEGFWVWYIPQDYEYMSPRFWDILGYLPHEKKSHPSEWQKLIHQNDLPVLLENFNRHVQSRGEVPFSMDVRYTHKKGHTIWIKCEGSVTEWDEHFNPLRVIGTHRNVTAEKEMQMMTSEISDLRARYIEYSLDIKKFFAHLLSRILFLTEAEYGFIGEIIEGEEGKYLKTYWLSDISWNEETKKFYQENAPKGFIFKNLNSLFGYVIRTGMPLITNDPSHHPESGGLPKGHPPLNSFMGIPIYFSGKFFAMAGVANRKLGFNEEFYKYLRPYFDVVGEMIHAKFMQDELEKQKSLTLHNSRLASIGKLAAGVGHEINNPLAILSGQFHFIEQHLKNKSNWDNVLKDRFDKINKSIARIGNIVKGLKSFSRSDDSVLETFDVVDLVKETVEMLIDIYKKEGVSINLSAESIASFVSGNRVRIQQVLVNLLSNAKDATLGKEKRLIDVHVFLHENMIRISVTDNGSGINNEVREKIFDPFFTTKKFSSGTGLGLSLVNNIVKEHNGFIEFETSLDKGTTFIVSLPLTKPTPQPSEVSRDKQHVWKFNKKILIVDDEDDIRDFLKYLLSTQCEKVFVAKSGLEALEFLNKNEVDLIISDIKMPDMDGFQLLENILRLSGKKPYFTFITGGVDLTPDQHEIIRKSTKGIIQKPFGLSDLQKKLEELF